MAGIEDDEDKAAWEQDEQESWQIEEGDPLHAEQLALDEDDTRLPWLESSDIDDYYGEEDDDGPGWGQVMRVGMMAIVSLGAIVGGIYWATHRSGNAEMIADGSLVPAESQPYKELPKDPGGKTFDGTGDTSFAVSEGQDRPAQIASGAVTDGAAVLSAAASDAKLINTAHAAQPKPEASKAPVSGGVGVQVSALSSKLAAEDEWRRLSARSNGLLDGVSHRVIEGTAEGRTVFRLQAVTADSTAAARLCASLKAARINCQVK